MQETGIGAEAKQYAEDHDKAEKAIGIVPYCRVTIEKDSPGGTEVLYRYDVPRERVWDWLWVYEWRKARFVCRYPRDNVRIYYSFYDKKSGDSLEYDSLRSRQVSAKALITKYTRQRDEYVAMMSSTLFFDRDADPIVGKFEEKIARAKARYEEITETINQHHNNQ